MRLPEKIRHYFERYSDPFTQACRAIVSINPPSEAAYACFWVQPVDFFDESLPIAFMWWHGEGGTESYNPSPLDEIRTETWFWGREMTSTEPDPHVFRIICEWISVCWDNAGGKNSKIPFYCYDYYSMDTYCLRKKRIVPYSELQADTRT